MVVRNVVEPRNAERLKNAKRRIAAETDEKARAIAMRRRATHLATTRQGLARGHGRFASGI